MSRAARAPPTAPPRHVSDHHALVPRTPLRRTCLCRIYTFTCACLTGPAGAAAAVDGCRPGHRCGCRMLRRRLGGAGAVLVVPQLTDLTTWGWLFRRLAALCTRDEPLSHSGPNGRLRCGREAAVPAEVAVPPPTSPPRCTLARAASHSTCGRRIWRCMRGRASRCEPWLRATSRLSWPRAAAWSKTARLGSGTGHPQSEAPEARGARGPRRPRARPRARVWRLSGLQSRPTAAWAARSEPWSPIQGAAQDAGCTEPSGARPRCA